jgi:hypothetical protein
MKDPKQVENLANAIKRKKNKAKLAFLEKAWENVVIPEMEEVKVND